VGGGELVGGSDIMTEMFADGELQALIKDAAAKAAAQDRSLIRFL
jgi:monothiol glutaredoxin